MDQVRLCGVVLSWLLALTLLPCVTNAAGDIDWTDEVTDPPGDVRDNLHNVATGRGDIDILSVRVVDAGASLEVTLKLAESHNPTAEYTIDLLADESAGFHLTWKRAFAATGPSGGAITVTGYLSRDGTALSWVMSKTTVAATATLRIDRAEAKLSVAGGLLYTDTVEGTAPDDDEPLLPKNIRVQVTYERLDLRNATVTVVYQGANASAVRAIMDLNTDGRVSLTEANAHANEVRERIARESRLLNSTLDGKRATRVSYSFDLLGAQGNVMGAAAVQFIMTQILEFPSPETRSSHTYCYETAIGGDEPWENKLFGDDPWGDECIGGDEPWENVFIGGDEPWENEAIGGDEPWENKVDVVFRLEAPDGWRFMTRDWPSGLADHLNPGGDVLEMGSAAAASAYASTVGRMNMLVFEEFGHDVDEGFITSCGVMLALAAMARITMLLGVRRKRALPR